MYQKQIEQLVVLQHVDDEIILLEEELRQAPAELAELEEQLGEFEKRGEAINEKMEMLQQQQSKLDNEIEEDDARIKKSKNKLMLASNTKEYHAMMREMDSLEKLNRVRDDEQIAVREEMLLQEGRKLELERDMSGIKEEYDAKKATLEERQEKAQSRLDSLGRKRKKASKAVPPPILGRYEFIRSRLENPVIVPVSDAICSGCHIMIPPQSYNELQRGTQILSCPNCQRLIFWEPSEVAEEEPKKKAAKKADA